MKNIFSKKEGQTLIILLLYMEIAITITTAAITAVVTNALGTDKVYQSTTTADVAESGAETAVLKLLRNPNYTGETLTVNGGTATISVTGVNPKTITSKGVSGNFTRSVVVTVETNNNVLAVLSWK